jgi:hypothetical protein
MAVRHEDMGTWVRFCLSEEEQGSASTVCLSQAVAEWFRERPNASLITAYGIERGGKTVEIHAFYSRSRRAPDPLQHRTTLTYEPNGKLKFTTDGVDNPYYRFEAKNRE